MLAALVRHDVRFLVVGAHALAAHGYPRATVDIDIWIDPAADNAHRVWQALAQFGAPLDDLNIEESDFARADIVAQFGLPPNRIDILTSVTGLDFERAWANRIPAELEGVQVAILGRADLITNKQATGREKDRFDVRGLEGES